MSLADEALSGILEMIEDSPSEYTWDGSTITCFASEGSREVVLSTDGNMVNAALSLCTPNANLPAGKQPPVTGNFITFKSRKFRVGSVNSLTNAPAFWLHCVDPGR